MCSDLIYIPVTNNLLFIVITTMLVIIVTLITITVLPKLTFFWVQITRTDGSQDMPMKNGTNVPSDKSSIISCVPYRACVMVIIRATVAKVMQNNLERMLAAWVIGRELE